MFEEKYTATKNRIQKKLDFLNAEEEVNRNGIFKDGKTFCIQEKCVIERDMELIEISSSLMIPDHLINMLTKKLKKHNGIKLYLHYLIQKYDIHIVNGLIPQYSNVTTKYQDKDQNLRKIGIRPLGSDWAEMHILRSSLGMSMSAIFVYLLKADSVEFAKTVTEFLVTAGIPTLPNINLYGEIRLEHTKSYFSRILQYQESGYI